MVSKIKYYKNFDVQKKHKNSIILIGNFDGVHLGHQKLFKKALILKKRKKYKIGVVTFDPIPKMFFFKKIRNYRISNFDQKFKTQSCSSTQPPLSSRHILHCHYH